MLIYFGNIIYNQKQRTTWNSCSYLQSVESHFSSNFVLLAILNVNKTSHLCFCHCHRHRRYHRCSRRHLATSHLSHIISHHHVRDCLLTATFHTAVVDTFMAYFCIQFLMPRYKGSSVITIKLKDNMGCL